MATRYVEVHQNPQGAGDTRPTGVQIVQNEGLEGKLRDKVMLVTGTSSGIGIDTVEALAATGARVFCTVRDIPKGEKALAHLLEPGRVEILRMDLNSLASVRECAAQVLERTSVLNVLICNAGIMQNPTLDRTADGFEAQFGTNHLAHFLLFKLLEQALLKGSAPAFNSRVVMVSSLGHRSAPVQFGNLNFQKPNSYDPNIAYANSKTANIYMANAIDRKYGARGLHGLAVNPGGIWTGLQKHMKNIDQLKQNPVVQMNMKSTAQGCATTVWAAVAPCWEGRGRRYLENCQESPLAKDGCTPFDMGYKAYAFDEAAEDRLWKESLELVGLPPDA